MNQSVQSSLDNVIWHYMQKLNVPVTRNAFNEYIEQSSYYPSLYSASEVLNKLGVANQGFSISEEELPEFAPPFVAYYTDDIYGKDFILVTALSTETITYIRDEKKEKSISRSDFLKGWQKVVFVAEADQQSGDKEYGERLAQEKKEQTRKTAMLTGVGLLLMLMIAEVFFTTDTSFVFQLATISIIKLLGLAVTILLLLYEIDRSNKFVKSICNVGTQTNCEAVLYSKAGKIFGISWGELGFFYFAATTLFALTPTLPFVAKMPCLALFGSIVAAYIPFSIYYQWKVVRQWCPLCLMVQAILMMELLWAIVFYWPTKSYPIASIFSGKLLITAIGTLSTVILMPVLLWYFVKPLLTKSRQVQHYKTLYKRFLYNPLIFKTLLRQQPEAPPGWECLGIELGNPGATTTILKVCSPFCGPCARAHPLLEEIITHNPDIKLRIIFTTQNSEKDRGSLPVKHLMAIAEKNENGKIKEALDAWYLPEEKNYDVFASKFPLNGELNQQGEKLESMMQWCREAAVMSTPTFYVNGRKLPDSYSIRELKKILG